MPSVGTEPVRADVFRTRTPCGRAQARPYGKTYPSISHTVRALTSSLIYVILHNNQSSASKNNLLQTWIGDNDVSHLFSFLTHQECPGQRRLIALACYI